MPGLSEDVNFKVGEGALLELLERSGINLAEVGRAERDMLRIKEAKVYQGYVKDENGNPQEVDLASVTLHPKWEDGPEWPVVQPGPLYKAPTIKTKVHRDGEWKSALVIPDMQIGFYHGPDGQLVSTHDERAIELVLQVVKAEKPSLIIMVGDNLDFPEFGRYRLSPAFAQTTQASIQYCTQLMYRFRLAAPDARIVYLAGNHDERLPNFIMDNATAAFGLSQGKHPQAPESEHYPVLSIPHLCHLDLSGVEYLPGYPANDFWVNERLKVIHGKFVKSNGSTSHKYLASEKVSVIYGHIHRIEDNLRTFDKWGGEATIRAASPGTLAKVTGAVPSTKGGLDLYGRPLRVVEDWQQGFGHIMYKDTGSHEFFYHNHHIVNGMVDFKGKVYEQDAV